MMYDCVCRFCGCAGFCLDKDSKVECQYFTIPEAKEGIHMTIREVLPARKMDLDIHLMDGSGKTVEVVKTTSKEAIETDMRILDKEYEYIIPLTRKIIFYVKV